MIQLLKAKPEDRDQIHQVRKTIWRMAYSGILPDDTIYR